MTSETKSAGSVPFRTRARTIDHLGREQIADVPTAVSELWKNAYDAYARAVSLHIYSGTPPVAAIFDDGHGMSREDFVSRWLVVGTESKAGDDVTDAALRNGIRPRPRQGQKGIGRLSVAAIGSAVLVVSRKAGHPFVAGLLDWRIFENPFLLLEDIAVPVIEFGDVGEFPALLPTLRAKLLENLGQGDVEEGRRDRLARGWEMFSELEKRRDPTMRSTAERISDLVEADLPDASPLRDWAVSGPTTSGTALLLADLNPFLTSWVAGRAGGLSEAEETVRNSLIRVLSGFSDPYTDDDLTLDYRVVVHRGEDASTVVARDPDFGLDFLRGLDHFVDGAFDEQGVFSGFVRAFGKDLGPVEIIPSQAPPTSTRDRVGAFSLCIGAYEPELKNSILSPEVHARVAARTELHSGLNVYRDGLRVMPYGRPENDFFKIEERRTINAGRNFWSSRRMFGRIAITRARNPNLRDKAGREGLIDNSASRAIQVLMIGVLTQLAKQYFGSESTVREELLPAIQAENKVAGEKAKAVRGRTLKAFRDAVRERIPTLDRSLVELEAVRRQLDSAVEAADGPRLWALGGTIERLVSARTEMRLPPQPRNLGSFERQYRVYRDRYATFGSGLDDVRETWRAEAERIDAKPDPEVARSHLGRNQKAVTDMLGRWRREILGVLVSEQKRVDGQVDEDMKEFYKRAAPLLSQLEDGEVSLAHALAQMDSLREQLTERFATTYDPYLRSVQQLSEGLDLDSALSYSDARQDTLEVQISRVQALAQVGISVEILTHELNSLNRRLDRAMSALPADARATGAFRDADDARRELVERLRFLSQMQIADGDAKRTISGEDVYSYVHAFFERALSERSIRLEATPEFLAARFSEFPSRIFPVFINLVNNALYWVSDAPERLIRLAATDGKLIVSDSGPGVDPDDVPNLFELFFTRRIRGRGVGLYLCRQTLAAGGHTIEYLTAQASRPLPGGNFAITLRDGING
nr:sensor histidine kinase [Brevundimonas diminuta]